MFNIINAIRQSSWDDWKETLYWLGFNVLGGLLPTWGTALVVRLRGQQIIFSDFAKHGEFALYSAAFLAPALLVVFRYARRSRYVLGAGCGLSLVIGLFVCVLVYETATSAAGTTEPIDLRYILGISMALLCFSLGTGGLAVLFESRRGVADLLRTRDKQLAALQRKFEQRLRELEG